MQDGSLWTILVLVILVLFSSFFSAAETAFSSLNLIRLRTHAEQGNARAAKVVRLAEQYDNVLSTILIGNNVVNILASSLAAVFFTFYFHEYGTTVSTAVLTVVILIFGEITPKSLAKEMPEEFACFAQPFLSLLVALCAPLNLLFRGWKALLGLWFHVEGDDTITDDELINMVSEAESEGDLTKREGELIRSAIEFDDVEVQEILTPRVDVTAVPDTADPEQLKQVLTETGYSRIPVYHGTIDNIVGVIHEKDFYSAVYKGVVELDHLMTPPVYTTPTAQIGALLRTLREKQSHLAVVLDEYGGTEGIVTLEDILEELVGEIWDEHDEVVEAIRPQSNGSWLVRGDASTGDLFEALDFEVETDSATVSGLVLEQLERLPKPGETFQLGPYLGEVTRTLRRRVTEIRLSPGKKPEPQPEKEGLHGLAVPKLKSSAQSQKGAE